jgi:hypothetical protein
MLTREGARTHAQGKQGESRSMKTVDIKGYTDKMRKTLVSLQKEKEKEKDKEKEISDPGTTPQPYDKRDKQLIQLSHVCVCRVVALSGTEV